MRPGWKRNFPKRSLEQAEENMKVSGKQYEVGLETLSDYLEAQVLWQQAYQTKSGCSFFNCM